MCKDVRLEMRTYGSREALAAEGDRWPGLEGWVSSWEEVSGGRRYGEAQLRCEVRRT